MKYISGVHALNLPCSLDTTGDWHRFGIQWDHPRILDTEDSVYGEYGIEECSCVPQHPGTHKTANHIRALLDMLAAGDFSNAQGMKNDYICFDAYTPEVFNKVLLLKSSALWNQISSFMGKEYGVEWLDFLENQSEEIA